MGGQAMVLTDGEPLVVEESPRAVTIANQIRTMSLLRPDKVAMREKDFGIWQEYTWEQTWTSSLPGARPPRRPASSKYDMQ